MTRAAARLLVALVVVAPAACGVAGDPRESRFVAPVDVLQVRWRRHLTEEPLIEYKPQEFASAAVSDDGRRVFVGSSAAEFFSFDAYDGAIVWKRTTDGGVASQPRYSALEDAVYVGTQGGALYALDARTGAERWVYRIKGPIESQPVYSDGILYFTSGENRVYAIDARTGKWKWQYDRETPESFTIRGYAAPLVTNGRVYVGFSDGYLACLSASTGEVNWARSLAGDASRFVDVDSTPLMYQGVLYVSSFTGGVYALDPRDGSVKWRFEVEGAGTVRAHKGRLYFAAGRFGLHCVDTGGHLVWRQSLASSGELSPPLLVGQYVMVSAASGGTYVADATTGRLYQYFAPGHGVTATPASDGRQVYVLSNGGYFYALSIGGERLGAGG